MGAFIVSLDCEGKWGMADHLEPYLQRALTDSALAAVYDRFVALFGRYDIPATFAYVMAFTLGEKERRAFPALVDPAAAEGDAWLAHYWADVRAGRSEGWFQPHALEAVRADGRHEIACHGFCHRPLGDSSIAEAGAEAELGDALAAARMKGVTLRTFIFPRNEIGNLAALGRSGFIGFREKLGRPSGAAGRLVRLAEEFNPWPAPQHGSRGRAHGLVPIPAGYFFNWRFGARRRVPPALTVRRWTNLLDAVAGKGGVAHLWLHPHNLITAPDTEATLAPVLAHAAKLRDVGRIEVMTQEAWCLAQRASADAS